MSNMTLASPVLSDAATVTDVGPTGTNIANVKTMQPSEAWVITGNAAVYQADLGAANVIDQVMMLHYGTTTNLTWRIRAATSQANLTAAPGFDSGVVSAYATGARPTGYVAGDTLLAIRTLSPSQNFQWWRIDINDSGATGYSIGRIYLSKVWQPAINVMLGWGMGFIDMKLKNRAIGGQTFPKDMGRLKFAEFTLDFESEDELFNNGYEIDRVRGEAKDVLWVRDPAATTHLHRQSIYGLMVDLRAIVNDKIDLFSKGYRIEELTA